MDHRLAAHLAHHLRQRLGIGDIELIEYLARHIVPVALRQIVDHRDFVPLLQQQPHGMRADIAGAAGD